MRAPHFFRYRAPNVHVACHVRAPTTSLKPKPALFIKTDITEDEAIQAARLRAEAYYEEENSRFKMSFIKQFAEQELRRLKASSPARLITLVATDESGKCVGTLDLKLDADDLDNRDLLRAESEDKVERCGYLTNVVVAAEKRGQGIGGQLVDFAARLAGKELGIDTLYCHADAQNQLASALYASCGFLRCSAVSEVAAGTLVGQKELLKLQVVK